MAEVWWLWRLWWLPLHNLNIWEVLHGALHEEGHRCSVEAAMLPGRQGVGWGVCGGGGSDVELDAHLC